MASQPTTALPRRAVALSLGEAAGALGVHRSTLLRWERGDRPMPVAARRQLDALIAARRHQPDRLLGAIRDSEPLPVSEWERRLDRRGRSDLRLLLAGGKLVLAPGVCMDAAGRRYVRPVLHVAKLLPVRGLDNRVPVDVSGHQLSAARHFAGITAKQLASRVGLAVSTVRDMEAAAAIPRGRVVQMVDGLGLPEILDATAIREVRLEAGWRLADVADRVGVHLGVVHRWETGENRVPVGRMLSLAAAMHEASALSPRAVVRLRAELLDAIVADVAGRPGTTRRALLRRHWKATLGRLGPQIDAESVLHDAIKSKQIVESVVTTVGPRGHRRTIRGLFLSSDAPSESKTKRLSGNDVADARYRAWATRAELAEVAGTTSVTVATLEARREQPIPLHWDAPIRAALDAMLQHTAAAGTPDEQALNAIVEMVQGSPGISPYRLRRQVATALGAMPGKNKAVTRALRELLNDHRLVSGPARLARGPNYKGLFVAGQEPQVPALTRDELRKLRLEGGWSAPELARAVGVPSVRVNAWERGDRPCPPDVAERIRGALAQAPPAKVGRQLSRLLTAASQPGGVASGELSTSFFTASGRATLRRAIDDGLVHIEERLQPRRNGRLYVRRYVVRGPETPSPAAVDRMTGAELRQARQAAGITQVALGALIGTRNGHVSGWETGRVPIPPGRVEELRAALGLAAPGS